MCPNERRRPLGPVDRAEYGLEFSRRSHLVCRRLPSLCHAIVVTRCRLESASVRSLIAEPTARGADRQSTREYSPNRSKQHRWSPESVSLSQLRSGVSSSPPVRHRSATRCRFTGNPVWVRPVHTTLIRPGVPDIPWTPRSVNSPEIRCADSPDFNRSPPKAVHRKHGVCPRPGPSLVSPVTDRISPETRCGYNTEENSRGWSREQSREGRANGGETKPRVFWWLRRSALVIEPRGPLGPSTGRFGSRFRRSMPVSSGIRHRFRQSRAVAVRFSSSRVRVRDRSSDTESPFPGAGSNRSPNGYPVPTERWR